MSQDPTNRDEVESLLAARQELGSAMEPALVDSFAEKIVAEVRRQTQEQREIAERAEAGGKASTGAQLTLAIVSIVMAIPLTAIALGTGSAWMAVVVWIGIVLVNFAFTLRHRGQH